MQNISNTERKSKKQINNKYISKNINLFFDSYNIGLNNMAIAMKGLKVKPTYEDLVGVAKPDGLEQITFPNRDVFFREWNGFILSQLGNEGVRQMQLQQEEASRHAF